MHFARAWKGVMVVIPPIAESLLAQLLERELCKRVRASVEDQNCDYQN